MDDKTLKTLLGAQQGELDAVLMYQKIADGYLLTLFQL